MHKIPNTFCPLKWDEVVVNSNHNYVFACCKATPVSDYESLRKQQHNLLAGVADPSCNYCWAVENNGGQSRRMLELTNFDANTFPIYNDTKPTTYLEINLGNECNFQCTYCGPKFSSKWDQDVSTKAYPIFADRFHYAPNENKLVSADTHIDLINNNKVSKLGIIGGEPLSNKKLWQILDNVEVDTLSITTNLSCSKATIDKLIAVTDKFKLTEVIISLDSTGENAEFTRFGMNYDEMLSNIHYLFSNAPKRMDVGFTSVLSSITIRDLPNMIELVKGLRRIYATIYWNVSYIVSPKIQSFATLPDSKREEALAALRTMPEAFNYIGAPAVINALQNTKFNKTLYAELERFVIEFSNRKRITPPLHLISK